MLTHSKLLFHFMSLCSMVLLVCWSAEHCVHTEMEVFFFWYIWIFWLKWFCSNCDQSMIAIIQLSLEEIISDTDTNRTTGSENSMFFPFLLRRIKTRENFPYCLPSLPIRRPMKNCLCRYVLISTPETDWKSLRAEGSLSLIYSLEKTSS